MPSKPMSAEEKLTHIYQWIEVRRKVLDDMTAPEYNRVDPAMELKAVLTEMDAVDEADPAEVA